MLRGSLLGIEALVKCLTHFHFLKHLRRLDGSTLSKLSIASHILKIFFHILKILYEDFYALINSVMLPAIINNLNSLGAGVIAQQ